jgi:beta-1,4-mannosyltransferase
MKLREIKNKIFNGRYKNFRIIQFSSNKSKNPYYTMVGEELISRGVDFQYNPNFIKIKEIIDEKPTVVHLHQLSPLYHGKNKIETFERANILLAKLRDIKIHGGKLVYTMHNPLPHNRIFTEVDEMINNEMCSLSDHIIVLGESAKEVLIEQYHVKTPISVIKHHSFKEYYGDKPDKNRARKELGLPSQGIIFGNIGNIKPYKGLEFIIKSFKAFAYSSSSPKNIHLCIAGSSSNEEYLAQLRRSSNENISIINRDLTELELKKYVSTLDYSVFAFKNIWASSSVVLSLSYGVPAIVPDIGCMGDYVEDSQNGFLYIPNDQNSLFETFDQSVNSGDHDHLMHKCNNYSKEYTASNSADKFLKIYKQVLNS